MRDAHKKRYFGLLLLFCELICAEVQFDGSFGNTNSLTGPNFQINADQGRQVGGNLFHSFLTFNINNGETATFTGLGAIGSITNIMTRVTGGQASQINGLLRSTIPNASLFFLNPSGVIFGPEAALDVQGAFHVSTADYIRLEEGGRFDANLNSNDKLLTTGQPEAFGFLDDKQPANIDINESNLVLLPPNTQDLTFSGGEISITENSNLVSVGGTLKLISVSSGGEIKFNNDDTNTFQNMGVIKLGIASSNPSSSNPSQIVGKRVVIRGGFMQMENAVIQNTTFPDNSDIEPAIDLNMTDSSVISGKNSLVSLNGEGKQLWIDSGKLFVKDGAEIRSNNSNSTKPNNFSIIANEFNVQGVHSSATETKRSIISALGNTHININTDNLTINSGGQIRTQGGNLSVSANAVTIDGVNLGSRSEIFAASPTQGDSGSLSLFSDQVSVLNGGRISTTTRARSSGSSGNIEISAKQVLVDGKSDRFESSINTEAQGLSQNSGDGGILSIQTDNLKVQNNALVTARTRGPGNAGQIRVEASSIEVNNNGKITSESILANAGKAGTIYINAHDSLILSNNSEITVATEQADSGNIDIKTDLLQLREQSRITTSVADGEGNGGNININPTLLILTEGSEIIANAQQGDAGNIDIQINQGGALFQSLDSVIEASSQLGIDGNVEINAPDVDISSRFKPLPGDFLDVATVIQKPCIQRIQGKAIQFINQKYQVLPDSPYALRTISYELHDTIKPSRSTINQEKLAPIKDHQANFSDC